jgi:hypothetical protein
MLPAASLFGTRFTLEDLAAIRERAKTESRSVADVFAEAIEGHVRQRLQAGVRPEVKALMEDSHRLYAPVFEALAKI